MSELSEEAKALLEREAHLDEPTPDELEAMRIRVVAALAASSGLDGQPALRSADGAVPRAVTRSAGRGFSSKLVAAAAVAALGGGALFVALDGAPEPSVTRDPERSPAPRAAPSPVRPSVAVTPSVQAPPTPEARSEKPDTKRRDVSLPTSKSVAPPPSVASPSASEEALLVAAAEAQLRAGHASAALALYERHLSGYPKGALRHESWSGRLLSLCALGRRSEARAELAPFAAQNPGSPTVQRIRRACGEEP